MLPLPHNLIQCSGSLVLRVNEKCRDPGSVICRIPCEDVGKWTGGLTGGEEGGVRGPICFFAVIPALGAENTYAYISPGN